MDYMKARPQGFELEKFEPKKVDINIGKDTNIKFNM